MVDFEFECQNANLAIMSENKYKEYKPKWPDYIESLKQHLSQGPAFASPGCSIHRRVTKECTVVFNHILNYAGCYGNVMTLTLFQERLFELMYKKVIDVAFTMCVSKYRAKRKEVKQAKRAMRPSQAP